MARRFASALFFPLLIMLVSLAVGLIGYANYDTYFSAEARAATRNGQNLRTVRVGMDTTQVYRIMGQPSHVAHFTKPEEETVYHYQHRPGTSDSYQILVNQRGIVSQVSIMEGN